VKGEHDIEVDFTSAVWGETQSSGTGFLCLGRGRNAQAT